MLFCYAFMNITVSNLTKCPFVDNLLYILIALPVNLCAFY